MCMRMLVRPSMLLKTHLFGFTKVLKSTRNSGVQGRMVKLRLSPTTVFSWMGSIIGLLYQCVSNVCNWTTYRCEDIFKNTSIPSGVQNQWPMVRVKLSAGGGRDWNIGRIIAQALVQRGSSIRKRYFSQKSDEASLQSFLPYNLESYVNNDHVTTSFISTQNFVIVG